MSAGSGELRVVTSRDGCALAGSGPFVELVNEFLGYLSDRNYSARTVRAYAFDLHFVRWLSAERLEFDAVDTDALLRYMSACRTAILPHQAGGNVYSIRDGRNAGYAPKTINRRLAASWRSYRPPDR